MGTIAILRQKLVLLEPVVIFDDNSTAAGKYYPDLCVRQAPFHPPRRRGGVRFVSNILGRGLKLRRILAVRLWVAGWRLLGGALLIAGDRAAIEELRNIDVVISAGGTYITDNYRWEFRFWFLQIAKALGKPVILMTQSIGPVRGARRRKRLGKVLAAIDLVLVRDKPSAELLTSIGVARDKVRTYFDAAFALVRQDQILFAKEANRVEMQRLQVAVSIRQWERFSNDDPRTGSERYTKCFVHAVTCLVREYDAQITFVSTCQGCPEYHLDDSKFAHRVFDRLSRDVQQHVVVDSNFRGPHELIEEFSRFDVLIGMRMHACILALCAGTPALPVAYEFKTRELFNRLGLAEFLCDIDTVEPDSFVYSIRTFLAKLPGFRDRLFRAIAHARNDAIAAGDAIKCTIERVERSTPSGQLGHYKRHPKLTR